MIALAVGVAAVVVGAAVWARRAYVAVTVAGVSMAPTLQHGQVLLARRISAGAPLRRGDLVVFTAAARRDEPDAPALRIKRVAAVPGDPVPAWVAGAVPGAQLSAAQLAVSGDNPRSEDSRQLGLIDRAAVVAVVRGRPAG